MKRGRLTYFGATFAVAGKDLRAELRSKETVVTLGLFGLVMTLIFAFGFAADPETNRQILPGILWSTLLFTGTLGIGRTFAREQKAGAFAALILSPAERSAILLAKIAVNLALMAAVMIVVTPVAAVLLRVDLTPHVGMVTLQLFLGALGFAVVGTPLAVMAINARFAEVLLPMVVFPLVTPVVISGVKGTGILLGIAVEIDPWPWLKLTAAFDVLYGLGGLMLFERMVTE